MVHLLRVMGYFCELWYTTANYGVLLNKHSYRIMDHKYELWYTYTNYGLLYEVAMLFKIISAATFFRLELFKGALLCVPFFCDALRNDIWKISCFENGTLGFEIRVTFRWVFLFEW